MQFAADSTWALQLLAFQAKGIRVLMETDDNYFGMTDRTIQRRANWVDRIGEGMHSVQGHRWITQESDGVICTTDELAKQYRKVNPNVYVCPNTVDPRDWPEPVESDGIFRVGWFASRSHTQDIPLVTRALEWASRQKDVQVLVMGVPTDWKFPYVRVPWQDELADYREAMQYLDLAVAPITPNPWALCRSDVKWLEYSMGAAASILSDVAPYADADDTNSVKVSNAKGFYHAVKHFVQNRDEARQLGQAAREYVLKHRTIQAQIGLWREAIAG